MKENLVRRLKKKVSRCKDKSINRNNKKLMMEKIFSYSPELLEGIAKYKDANRNFMLLMFLSIILIEIPVISILFCIVSIGFLVKMLQFIRYRNINTIVNILGKDLAYRGIYDKGKIQGLIEEFRDRYGTDIVEYEQLIHMVNKYELLITKIEYVISNMKSDKVANEQEKVADNVEEENNVSDKKVYTKEKVKDYYGSVNKKLSLVCRDEDGEIKKVNRAIEFFDNENSNGEKTDTVILKSNRRGNQDKLTVYLYKKSSNLQNNVL